MISIRHKAISFARWGMLLLLLMMLGVTLAGCVPQQPPPGMVIDAPHLTAASLITRDGTALELQRWPADHPRAIIIALHGMGDYANAFALPAPDWAAAGITTYAYDQRGFGRGHFPGLWPGAEMLRQDLDDAVIAVRMAHPDLPVYVLGESMGGAVVLTALARGLGADGAILVAPAVWSGAEMPLLYPVTLFLAAHVAPWIHVSGGHLNIWPSDNIALLRAMARDPLVQKHSRIDAVYGLVNLMDEARVAVGRLDPSICPPVLLLYGAKDQIVPAQSTEAVRDGLQSRLGNGFTVYRYGNGYHMLLRDRQAAAVRRDSIDWIMKPYKGRRVPLFAPGTKD
ncbi:MAG: lysophospholipase [Rhizomicrobium sp.]